MSKEETIQSLLIPVDVIADDRLSAKEKIIYSVIHSFKPYDCELSNPTLKIYINSSWAEVAKIIKDLRRKRYISERFQSGTRKLTSIKKY